MQNVIEANGNVYPCDFYAFDEYCAGNVCDEKFAFNSIKTDNSVFFENAEKRDDRCSGCKWYPICRGGCRRDCASDGKIYVNKYCEAYSQFFEYTIERMEEIASHLAAISNFR